jgi:integrase
MANLTKRGCDAARYRGGGVKRRDVRWDGKVTGLGLRLFPTGAKSWVLSYRNADGRKRLHTISDYHTLTLEKARDAALDLLSRIRAGADPVAGQHEPKPAPALPTFGDVADLWAERYADTRLRTAKEARQRLAMVGDRFRDTAAVEITSPMVVELHARLGKERGPYQANRTIENVRGVFNWAADPKRGGLLPTGHPNPAAGIERFKERSRSRWLTERELGRLLRALDREEPETQAIVRLMLLTGVRKGEVLGAQWSHVDLDARRWLLPETKNDEPRVVPLSVEAVQIIRDLPRRLGSPYLFPSPKDAREPLADLKRPWERIRRRARLHGVRVHDLRRTVGASLAQAGVPLQQIGEALGHKSQRATLVYARLAAQQSRDALDLIGTAIAGVEAGRKRARRA